MLIKDSVDKLIKAVSGYDIKSKTIADSITDYKEKCVHTHILEHHSDIVGDDDVCTIEYDLCTADGCDQEVGYKFNQHYNSEHSYGALQYKKKYFRDSYYIVCSKCNNVYTLTSTDLLNYTEEEKQAAIDAYEQEQGE